MKLKFFLIPLALLIFNIGSTQITESLKENKRSSTAKLKNYTEPNSQYNRPNIIYILVDDLGYGDLGVFWQNQLKRVRKMATPMLDKMAIEGAIMTHHYTGAPVCAPARASLLEGLTQGHSSVRDNQFDKESANRLTLAAMLSQAGYHTMHVGKAGIAGKRNSLTSELESSSDLKAHPLKRGFKQFFGYLFHNQGHIHYPLNGSTRKEAYFTEGYAPILEHTELTYTTDVFTAKSKQWIIDHKQNQPEQPFFLYLAYDVPHSAYQVPTQAYPSGWGLEGGVQWTGKDSPTPWVNTAKGVADSFIHPDYEKKSWDLVEKKFATMIRRLDNAVEDLIHLLKDLNIDDNTIIVFSSDNGPTNAGHDAQYFQSYANLTGVKRDLWEGGTKMPTIVRYPGIIPAESQVSFPSGHWDWMATFAELAKVPIPAYTDGVSLMPALKSEMSEQVGTGFVYQEYFQGGQTPNYADFELAKRNRRRGQMQVIRLGDYKGVRYDIQNHSTPFEIYNVVSDPGEKNNLASSMPELHQKMKDKVLQVRKVDTTASRPYDVELIPASRDTENKLYSKGLIRRLYSGTSDWVPNFEYLTPLNTSISKGITTELLDLSLRFGLSYTGYIDIPKDGEYTFYLKSTSNCHVMIHDIHLLDNDFNYSDNEISETLNLKKGKHPIRIFYQQNRPGRTEINLQFSGPDIQKTKIPESFLLH